MTSAASVPNAGEPNRRTRTYAVFTKPWRDLPVPELGRLVVRMGFTAIEFPLRPGYQVDLDQLESSLGEFVRILNDHGLGVASVAGSPDDRTLASCAAAGINLLRIMVPIGAGGYLSTGDQIRRDLDDVVIRAARHGVRIGVQPHYDYYIADSSELAVLIKDYDPTVLVAIWDAAHDGLAGKHPANALPLLGPRLAMANFKNACYQPGAASAGAASTRWQVSFVDGRSGLCSWPEAAATLRDLDYRGPICLPAEYTDERNLESKVAADLSYLQRLLDAGGEG